MDRLARGWNAAGVERRRAADLLHLARAEDGVGAGRAWNIVRRRHAGLALRCPCAPHISSVSTIPAICGHSRRIEISSEPSRRRGRHAADDARAELVVTTGAPMTLSAGSRLGPYEIVAPIGAGGMGEVYRARDTRLDRAVAIKILPAEFATNGQLKIRLEREAKTISQPSHPNICTLFDVGENYLVMELLEGETLADRLSRGPLPLADAVQIGIDIADALDRAHRAGITHRDLKPGNVMITASGVKLLDFGLAKIARTSMDDPAAATLQKSITEDGTI